MKIRALKIESGKYFSRIYVKNVNQILPSPHPPPPKSPGGRARIALFTVQKRRNLIISITELDALLLCN